MRFLQPCETAASVLGIDYERLRESGIHGLLFDLDRTLGPAHMAVLPHASEALLSRLEVQGFRIGILTNRRWSSDDPVIRSLAQRFPTLDHARKPRRAGFNRLLAQLRMDASATAMIGNSRLTDVWGANRVGMHSILVRSAPQIEG